MEAEEGCRKNRKKPLVGTCGLMLQCLLSTGGGCCGQCLGWCSLSAQPLRAAAETLPAPASQPSPLPAPHIAQHWLSALLTCPAPDPAGAPTPPVCTILALLPQGQNPSCGLHLSLMFSLWKAHGCCAYFSPQAWRLLRLQGPCPARIQPHRQHMGFPLAVTAAAYDKPSFLHSCMALRPGNAGFCLSQTNSGTPSLCIELQNNLHIYQPGRGALLSQGRAALLQPVWLPSIPSQHWS